MQPTLNTPSEPVVPLPVMAVADVQDSLLVAMHDLHRLEGLLNHAAENLLARFDAAMDQLALMDVDSSEPLRQVRDTLRSAVTELQFHDMSTQLIVHTNKILQGCASRLACEAMSKDDGEVDAPYEQQMPERPNPVTQSEMDAGSVELF